MSTNDNPVLPDYAVQEIFRDDPFPGMRNARTGGDG
jgi:hypothetical protein